MVATHCTSDDLQAALSIINKKYDGRIEFEELSCKGKSLSFKLKTTDKDRRGASLRMGQVSNGRAPTRSARACWHVHGDMFDALLKVQPDAVVRSGRCKITIDGGNWEDRNIGSQMDPLNFSESCWCNFFDEMEIETAADMKAKLVDMGQDKFLELFKYNRPFRLQVVTYCPVKYLPLLLNEEKKGPVWKMIESRIKKGR